MKRIVFIVIFILALVGCSETRTGNVKKNTAIINFTDITAQNKDSAVNFEIKDGNVQIMSMRPHSGSISASAYFKSWKPYEKIEVYSEEGVLKIYYTEKNTDKIDDVIISFITGFDVDEKNTEIYKNGVFQEGNIQYVKAME
ncbi:MAG TPA: hypothetical protein VIO64_08855 [Pseudobacteroides sp.]|uniref:hypothetical protein n=1 Tax=Pseudobacteroides sp. TaxID=1968840 RepID=UPI002F9305CD